jgi:hypothetical protein
MTCAFALPEIASVRLPDTALCRAAAEFAQRASEPFLFHHVLRSAFYAEWLGQRRQLRYDRELLCVSTLLHDLGLTSLAPVRARFEIEGADAAKEFLVREGMSERAVETAWEAIALHTTAEIPLRRGPEVALCHLGVACDIRGMPGDAAADRFAADVTSAYPRLELHRALPDALVGLFRKNSAASASHAVADACERMVPGFRRFNLCDILLAHDSLATGRST